LTSPYHSLGLPLITDFGLSALLYKSAQLRTLRIEHCPKIRKLGLEQRRFTQEEEDEKVLEESPVMEFSSLTT
jgi:hypothetical protein